MKNNNHGKILQFSNTPTSRIRRLKNTWNYYQTLFFISLSVNLIMFAYVLMR